MTLQEIQYKAQGIIHKWRDDDSAPYIEFVEELAHMIVPEPSEDLEEAADNHIRKVVDAAGHPGWDWTTQDIADAFIAGAKWQAEHAPLPEDAVLFNKGVEEGKRLMMEEAEEGEVILNPYPIICLDDCKNYDFKDGDKVRIIILPKED